MILPSAAATSAQMGAVCPSSTRCSDVSTRCTISADAAQHASSSGSRSHNSRPGLSPEKPTTRRRARLGGDAGSALREYRRGAGAVRGRVRPEAVVAGGPPLGPVVGRSGDPLWEIPVGGSAAGALGNQNQLWVSSNVRLAGSASAKSRGRVSGV